MKDKTTGQVFDGYHESSLSRTERLLLLLEDEKRGSTSQSDPIENVDQSKNYAKFCVKWAKMDYWPPEVAVHLLAGLHPESPEIPNRSDLTAHTKRIASMLEYSDVPRDQRTKDLYQAKAVIEWAQRKEIHIPEPLLKALAKPSVKPDKEEHGNTRHHGKNRELVLGAAVKAVVEYPEQCKGHGNKITGHSIASFIETKPELFFENRFPPLALQTMAKLINYHLKKIDSN